jgi:hypothetical protein
MMEYAKHRYDIAGIYLTNAMKEKKEKSKENNMGKYLYKKKENKRNSCTGQSIYICTKGKRMNTHIDNTT